KGRVRQALILTDGAVVGGIKDIPRELANHPWEVAGKLAVASATGAVLGAATAAESPLIAGAALVAGVATTGAALWNSYSRLSKNEKLEHALKAVYVSSDLHTMCSSGKEACDAIGPEAFDYGIAMVGMPVGVRAPRIWSNLNANYFA